MTVYLVSPLSYHPSGPGSSPSGGASTLLWINMTLPDFARRANAWCRFAPGPEPPWKGRVPVKKTLGRDLPAFFWNVCIYTSDTIDKRAAFISCRTRPPRSNPYIYIYQYCHVCQGYQAKRPLRARDTLCSIPRPYAYGAHVLPTELRRHAVQFLHWENGLAVRAEDSENND